MATHLKPGKSIKRQLKRIMRTELRRASRRLRYDHSHEAIHEGRKRVKKAEAVLRLLERIGFDAPRKDVKRLRSARHALSTSRDADVMIETFDRLRSRFPGRIPEHTSAIIRAHLLRAKADVADRARREGSELRAANKLRQTRRSVKQWSLPSIEASDLPAIIRRSFRASRKAMKRAQKAGDAAAFHRWRKRVKSLWYHLRLAQCLVSDLSGRIAGLKQLETHLGEEHNLAVLRSRLAAAPGLLNMRSEINEITAIAEVLQTELRRKALKLGTRLHAITPKQFAKDLRRRLTSDGSRGGALSPRIGAAA
jgi:CHAD domain-containing protein